MSEQRSVTLSGLRPPVVANAPVVRMGFGDSQSFELLQRAAKMLASSSIVPKEYMGNIANCAIALNMAQRIGADPMMVCQNLVIVHGRPTWSAQFLTATVNACGRFSALRYEFFGERGTDTWGCHAWAIEKSTSERLVGPDITIAIAKAEGWYSRNGSKWKTIPQLMMQYRAASWWTRSYAPELSMGLHTEDEIRDVYDAVPTSGGFAVQLDSLRQGAPDVVVDRATGEIIDVAEGSDELDLDAILTTCVNEQAVRDFLELLSSDALGDISDNEHARLSALADARIAEFRAAA